VNAPQHSYFLGPDDAPDKYRLLQQFGAGGEAQLWRAVLTLAGESEPVAVKVLRPELHGDLDDLTRRWSEQAELLRFVQHPGVVGVREHFVGASVHAAGQGPSTPDRSLCLVMNWVDGHALRDWMVLNPGVEGLLRSLTILEQVAELLDWLHSGRATPSGRVVVHGDLSPGNIMVDTHGQAVLVDFGLTRLTRFTSHRTMRPAFTPGFAAPEVWSAGEYSPAGDRYAFGAIGYFLLTGEVPPNDLGAVHTGLASVPMIGGGDPGRLGALMLMFDPDPARRPAALDWVRTLRTGATTAARRFDPRTAQLPPVPPTAQPVPATARGGRPEDRTAVLSDGRRVGPAPPPRKRRGKLLVAAAALLVALGVVGGLLLPGLLSEARGTAPGPSPSPVIAAPETSAVPTTPATAAPTTAPLTLSPDGSGPSTAPVGSGAITYLADIRPILGSWYGSDGTDQVDGRTYTHVLHDLDCNGVSDPREIEYNLGRAYTSFESLLGVSDASDSSGQYKVEVFVDGIPVGTWTVQRGSTEEIELPVVGALTLEFTVSTLAAQQNCSGGLTLADPKLIS